MRPIEELNGPEPQALMHAVNALIASSLACLRQTASCPYDFFLDRPFVKRSRQVLGLSEPADEHFDAVFCPACFPPADAHAHLRRAHGMLDDSLSIRSGMR